MLPAELATAWRQQARDLRALALESLARAYEKCAAELQEAVWDALGALLGLQEAALLGPCSPGHLRRFTGENRLPIAGIMSSAAPPPWPAP